MSDELINFSDAAQQLQVSESELDKLVANREIDCVKDGDEIFFKPDIIAQFKKSAKTEPTIILSDDEMDLLDGVEEINLDEFDIPEEEEEVSISLSADDDDLLTGEPEVELSVPAGGAGEKEEAADDDGLEDFDLSDLSLDDDEADDDSATSVEDLGDLTEISLDDEDEAEAPQEEAADDDFGELTLEGDDDLDILSLDDDDDSEATQETADAGDLSDDTVLSLDGLLDDDDVAQTDSTTPVPGTEVDGLELDLDDDDDLTLEGSISDDTILDTDVLDLTDEDDDFNLDEGLDPASTLIRSGGPRTMQMQRAPSHALFTFFLMLGTLLSMVPIAVMMSIFIFDRPGDFSASDASQWITEANFLKDAVNSIGDSIYDMISG